jgi:hypothetical protein
MPAEDALLTVAEISMIFAGFSGILMVLRRRPEGWLPVELLALRLMVGSSLSALLFSFVPVVLFQLGASGTALWRTSSASLGLFLLAMLIGIPIVARRMGARPQAPRLTALGAGISAVVIVAQCTNAFGWGIRSGPGLYLLGAVWLLLSAAAPLVVFVAQQRAEPVGEAQ